MSAITGTRARPVASARKEIIHPAAVGSSVDPARYGFHVTRDGEPVPAQVYPPALLTFAEEDCAVAYARAIDTDDSAEAHRLIAEHGRWWA